jgi:hypothetical protein
MLVFNLLLTERGYGEFKRLYVIIIIILLQISHISYMYKKLDT